MRLTFNLQIHIGQKVTFVLVKEIKALERRWVEEWNKGKAAAMVAIDEFFATDYVEHGGTGEDIHASRTTNNL